MSVPSTLGTAGKRVGTVACLVLTRLLSFSVSPCSLLSTRSALQKVSSLICCEFPLEFLNFFLFVGCVCPCLCLHVCARVCGVCVCGGQWLTSAVFVVLHLMFLRLDLVGELAVSARLADKRLPGSACLSASSPY